MLQKPTDLVQEVNERRSEREPITPISNQTRRFPQQERRTVV